MLLIVDIRLRMLPTPDDLVFAISSPSIFCVLGRGFGRFCGVAVPALNCISSRKLSRSDANLRRAFSKSASLRPDPPMLVPLIVALLLLLAVGLTSGPIVLLMDLRASKLCVDLLLPPSAPLSPSAVGGLPLMSVSSALSSSIVASTGGEAAPLACRRSS